MGPLTKNIPLVYCCFAFFIGNLYHSHSQDSIPDYQHEIALNTIYLLADASAYLVYENRFSDKFSAGAGLWYGRYGDGSSDFTDGFGDGTRDYEITPFARWYVRGTQRTSFFIQGFASIYGGRYDGISRETTAAGYGVYRRGINNYTNLALGAAIGQEFLLFKKRVSLELVFGLGGDLIGRNSYYDYDWGVSTAQSGINIGYRF